MNISYVYNYNIQRVRWRIMRLFKIRSKCISYDEDISMVIIAQTKDAALRLARKNWIIRDEDKELELDIEEIYLNKELIVDVSHYGE